MSGGLSSLSDADLLRQLNAPSPASPAPAGEAPSVGLGGLSDADLIAALGSAGQTQGQSKGALASDYDAFRSSAPVDGSLNLAGGVARGIATTAGLPNMLLRGGEWLADKAVTGLVHSFGGTTRAEQLAAQGKPDDYRPPSANLPSGEAINASLDPYLPEARTNLGKIARPVGEFFGGGLAMPGTYGLKGAIRAAEGVGDVAGPAINAVRNWGQGGELTAKGAQSLLAGAVGGGLGSQALGGMAGGTPYEEPARLLGGLAGAVAGHGAHALATGPSMADRMIARGARNVTDEQFARAADLRRDAPDVTAPEAIQWASNGQSQLGNLQRIAENTEGGSDVLGSHMASRPARQQQAVSDAFAQIGNRDPMPSQIAMPAREAAHSAVWATPQGRALQLALAVDGRRMSGAEAGEIIQPELSAARTARMATRTEQGNRDYTAAEENAPLRMFEQGRLGQVDPIQAIDEAKRQMANAKGGTLRALNGAYRDLHETEIDPLTGVKNPDLSLRGLHNARVELQSNIDHASAHGQTGTVHALNQVRQVLDAQLKSVPEFAAADANFQRNSIPLEPFHPSRPMGLVTAEQRPGIPQMPPEQVPQTLATPRGQQDLNGIGSPTARAAMDNWLVGREMEAAPDGRFGYGFDPNGMRSRLGQSGIRDVLAEAPNAAQRIIRVLEAREGLASREASPLGQLAHAPTTRQQLAILFGKDASAAETGDAVRALADPNVGAAHNPDVARALVREQAGRLADDTLFDTSARGTPDQFGGAKMAKRYFDGGEGGEFGSGAALRAGVEAAAGKAASDKLHRVMEGLQATGWRQPAGSLTAFNAEAIKGMRESGPANLARKVTRPIHAAHEAASKYALEHNSRAVADRFLASDGVDQIQRLVADRRARIADLPNKAHLAALMAVIGAQHKTAPQR